MGNIGSAIVAFFGFGSIGDNPVFVAVEEEEEMRRAQKAAQRAEKEANRARAAQEEADRARQKAEEEATRTRVVHEEAERNARATHEEAERARERAEEKVRRLAREELERNARAAQEEEDRARQGAEEKVTKDRLAREESEKNERAARDQAEKDKERADGDIRNARIAQDRAEQEKRRAEDDAKRATAEKEEADRATQRAEEKAAREKEAREEGERKARVDQEEAERKRQDAERERQKAEDNERIANAAVEEAELKWRHGIHPVVWPTTLDVEKAKRRFEYVEGALHFAVVGIAGSGKSSLVNAFRGLRKKGPSSAPTGVVETTQITTRYPDPHRDRPFVWYDAPGAGTLSIPDWMYFNQQGLYVFDCIIVLFDNRFTATDIAILQNCARFKIPSYIVRSKSDQHIQNMMDDMADDEEDDEISLADRKNVARERFIAKTCRSVDDNLKKAEMPEQKVYIISKKALLCIVEGKPSRDIIDEEELLMDILEDAHRRRGEPANQSTIEGKITGAAKKALDWVAITARSNNPYEGKDSSPDIVKGSSKITNDEEWCDIDSLDMPPGALV